MSLFAPSELISAADRDFHSMLHEEPDHLVSPCFCPATSKFSVMPLSACIGGDREQLIPRHFIFANPDFMDLCHIAISVISFSNQRNPSFLNSCSELAFEALNSVNIF